MPTAQDIEPSFYSNSMEIGHMAEADDNEFEEALTEARNEGNLSRANIVRKVDPFR